MTDITCPHCKKPVEGDAYFLHLWNYHNVDARSLAKPKKKKIIIPFISRKKKEKDYSKVKNYFQPPKKSNKKKKLAKRMIAFIVAIFLVYIIYNVVF